LGFKSIFTISFSLNSDESVVILLYERNKSKRGEKSVKQKGINQWPQYGVQFLEGPI
jgi:hypothetical protein